MSLLVVIECSLIISRVGAKVELSDLSSSCMFGESEREREQSRAKKRRERYRDKKESLHFLCV